MLGRRRIAANRRRCSVDVGASGQYHNHTASIGRGDVGANRWLYDQASPGSCGGGYFNVATSSSTSFSGRPVVGSAGVASGTGSCSTSIAASRVTSAPISAMTVSGTVVAKTQGRFTIESASCGYLHVFVTNATAGSVPAVGATTNASGSGSCSTYLLASSIGSTSSIVAPWHVLTADYLGSPWGSNAIAYSTVAHYLTWAETGTPDASAIAAAGIKTMLYTNPNRTTPGVGDELYTTDDSTFAHTCTSGRLYDSKDGVTEWVMNPSSGNLRTLYAGYVRQKQALAHFDAVFEDVAGPLSEFEPYDPFKPGYPCSYTDSAWIDGEIGLAHSSPLPVFANSLSGLNGHSPSLSLALLNDSNTIGATFEECYSWTNQKKAPTWYWAAIENTEIAMAEKHKLFQCLAEDTYSAGSEVDARRYLYASFLLTYDPNTSIYRNEFATASGVHVMPEAELVPLSPVVTEPTAIGALEQPGGTYARKFNACYLRRSYAGPCAVVVNPSYNTQSFPFTTYHHTLTFSGGGALDGGSVSIDGPAPPSSLPPLEAEIVFP